MGSWNYSNWIGRIQATIGWCSSYTCCVYDPKTTSSNFNKPRTMDQWIQSIFSKVSSERYAFKKQVGEKISCFYFLSLCNLLWNSQRSYFTIQSYICKIYKPPQMHITFEKLQRLYFSSSSFRKLLNWNLFFLLLPVLKICWKMMLLYKKVWHYSEKEETKFWGLCQGWLLNKPKRHENKEEEGV